MIGGSLLPDASSFLDSVVAQIKHDVGAASSSALNNVRTDLANAVGDAGAGLTDAATSAIAPSGKAPVLIPLSATQFKIVVAALLIGAVFLLWLVVRKKR